MTFLALIIDSSDDITPIDDIPKEVQEKVKLYRNSDSMSKIVILALFHHDKYKGRYNELFWLFEVHSRSSQVVAEVVQGTTTTAES